MDGLQRKILLKSSKIDDFGVPPWLKKPKNGPQDGPQEIHLVAVPVSVSCSKTAVAPGKSRQESHLFAGKV